MPNNRTALSADVGACLRELSYQLNLLGRHVSAKVRLKETDLDCLDLISRSGPITAGALSKATGIHAATLTGIVDRLEADGWVVRARDEADRRAVYIEANPKRLRAVFRLYAGMTAAVDDICSGYSQAHLRVIADFLHRTLEAAQGAAADIG